MATNSRNIEHPTSTFKGLVSWLCLLLILCAVCTAGRFAVLVLTNPETLDNTATHLQEVAGDTPGGATLEEALEQSKQREDLFFSYTVQTVSGAAILLTALILIFAFRQDRRAFERTVAQGLGWVWVEVKLAVLVGMVSLTIAILMEARGFWRGFGSSGICVLAVYLLCLDIGHNRRYFGHNIIHSILVRVNDYKDMTTFQQRCLRRVYSVIAIVLGLIAVGAAGFWIIQEMFWNDALSLAAPVGAGIGIVGAVWWYILSLKRDLADWNLLMEQITEMYGGNLDAVNHVPPTSNLYDCAMQLNMIRTGVQKAVEEGTKADRTKIELITNVSHDIKTPLTSIISYVELLKKETGLPPQVEDYVNIISQKTQRLSSIVQDVFEVSKAATGNISLNMEVLDIGRLLRQTFVEMDETIQKSRLQFRVDIPDAPMAVQADGQRMYRVFQNLIRNCTQYSLEGSRVYVTLLAQAGTAQVSIRNISKTEFAMNGENLTARFVRGDQNRTTEGSGLGLSIAKSFTEACGGRFFVRTDGDLFVATVQFPLIPPEEAASPQGQDNGGPVPTLLPPAQTPIGTPPPAEGNAPGPTAEQPGL